MAADEDHALEQAEDANPGWRVHTIGPDVNAKPADYHGDALSAWPTPDEVRATFSSARGRLAFDRMIANVRGQTPGREQPEPGKDRVMQIASELARVHTFTLMDGEAIARAALALTGSVPVDEAKLAVDVPPIPFGPKGVPYDKANAGYYRSAAKNIRYHARRGRSVMGSNLTEAVARLCDATADALYERHRLRGGAQ